MLHSAVVQRGEQPARVQQILSNHQLRKPRRLPDSYGEPTSQMNDNSFLIESHHTGTCESSLDSNGSRRSRRKKGELVSSFVLFMQFEIQYVLAKLRLIAAPETIVY